MASTHPSNCISSVVHSSCLVQTALKKGGNTQSKDKKLHNSDKKLHNSGRLMDAEKRVIASTSLQDVFIKQALEAETHETEKQDLERRKVEALERWVQLQQERQHVEPNDRLSFTKDELDQYVAHRKEGLAEKSLDWVNRASHALWNCTKGEISHTSIGAFTRV